MGPGGCHPFDLGLLFCIDFIYADQEEGKEGHSGRGSGVVGRWGEQPKHRQRGGNLWSGTRNDRWLSWE